VLAAWVAVLAAVVVGSGAARGTYTDRVTLPTQGYHGLRVLQAGDPAASGFTGRVVLHSDAHTVVSARVDVADATAALRRLPHVLSASDPLSPRTSTVSADGHTAYSSVQFDVIPKSLGSGYVARLDAATAPLRAAGFEVEYGGDLDLLTQPPLSDGEAELIGFAVALLVLLVGFGSIAGAAIPLLAALVSVGVALSALGILASWLTFATAAPTLAVMIGLGVAIDYALFVTTRYRQLLADGADPVLAAGVTAATSGRAVLIAATTVSVAIVGLYSSGLTFIGKLGLAAVFGVVTAGAAAVTLVPAALGLLGRRIDRLSVGTPVAESRSDSDACHRYAALVGRKPWAFLLAGISILGVLALPALSLRLGHVDNGADPTSWTDKRAYDLISRAYGPGANGPFTVVVALGPPTSMTTAEVAAKVRLEIGAVPDVAGVSPLAPSQDGRLLVGTVTPRTGPQVAATTDLFHRLVRSTLPAALQGTGATGYVTGSAALQVEFADQVSRGLVPIILVVVGTAFLLLLATFRGLLLAIKAAVLNILSIAAAYGVVVAIFQWGWGRSLLGVSENVPIESYVPMMMFAIVFGLSLDYEVFLLSRVKELWDATGDNSRSVAGGLAATARVISGAALIMVSVFAAFSTASSAVIKMIAIGLAFSILIDATVVRLLLVPAVMNLLGGASSWWMPRWMDRVLPRLSAESAVGAWTAFAAPDPATRHPDPPATRAVDELTTVGPPTRAGAAECA
jgi:putative drug exporter of the RND superfamily